MGIVSSIISGLFQMASVSIVMLGVGLGVAVITVPANKKLQDTISDDVSCDIQSKSNNGIIGNMMASAGSGVISKKTSAVNYRSFVAFRVAKVTMINGENRVYIGAFGQWFWAQ